MFLAIDRLCKFTHVEFRDNVGRMNGAEFLRNMLAAVPYPIHKVLTDNGMAFADLSKNRERPNRRYFGPQIFHRVCTEHDIEYRLTKPYRPWAMR